MHCCSCPALVTHILVTSPPPLPFSFVCCSSLLSSPSPPLRTPPMTFDCSAQVHGVHQVGPLLPPQHTPHHTTTHRTAPLTLHRRVSSRGSVGLSIQFRQSCVSQVNDLGSPLLMPAVHCFHPLRAPLLLLLLLLFCSQLLLPPCPPHLPSSAYTRLLLGGQLLTAAVRPCAWRPACIVRAPGPIDRCTIMCSP